MNRNRSQNSFLLVATLGVLVILSALSANAQPSVSQQIDQSPLIDLGRSTREKTRTGKLDLGAPFAVELKGSIGKDGRLDAQTAVWSKTEGDAQMVELTKSYISALSDSNSLRYLSDLDISTFLMSAGQNDREFAAALSFDTRHMLRAKSIETLLRVFLDMSRTKKGQDGASEADKRDLVLLNAATVTSSDKTVMIALKMPKTAFREVVESYLKDK